MQRLSRIFLRALLVAAMPVCAGPAKLMVSAAVVPSCNVRVQAPRVGTNERATQGTATFDAQCTRLGSATAPSAHGPGERQHEIELGRPEVRFSKGFVPDPRPGLPTAPDHEPMVIVDVLF